MKCENCELDNDSVARSPKMNAYKADPPDLCPVCMDEYIDHWNEQWAEYYHSQGYPQTYEKSNLATDLDWLRWRVANHHLVYHGNCVLDPVFHHF